VHPEYHAPASCHCVHHLYMYRLEMGSFAESPCAGNNGHGCDEETIKTALGLAREGRFLEAERLASAIEPDSARNATLCDIAFLQVASGRLAEATGTAAELDMPFRGRLLNCIAVAQARLGQFTEAKHTAEQIGDENNFFRASALRQVAVAEAAKGLFDEAKHTVASIADGILRARALMDVASAELGSGADAEQTLASAKQALAAIADAPEKTLVARDVARMFSRLPRAH
jgi:hypothetical protein